MSIRNLFLTIVAALALAACGNDATPTSTGASATTSAVPAEAPKQAAVAQPEPAKEAAASEEKSTVEAKAEPAKEDSEKKTN